MRAEKTYRVEFILNPRYREDRDVIEYLEKSENKSRECRTALTDYVLGSRYAQQQRLIVEQQQTIEELNRQLAVLQKVINKLADR